jgi:hypothetical protein
MDITLRMYTQPSLLLDQDKLNEYLAAVQTKLEEDLARIQRVFDIKDRTSFLRAFVLRLPSPPCLSAWGPRFL